MRAIHFRAFGEGSRAEWCRSGLHLAAPEGRYTTQVAFGGLRQTGERT